MGATIGEPPPLVAPRDHGGGGEQPEPDHKATSKRITGLKPMRRAMQYPPLTRTCTFNTDIPGKANEQLEDQMGAG